MRALPSVTLGATNVAVFEIWWTVSDAVIAALDC
jgi:hypothetical protein